VSSLDRSLKLKLGLTVALILLLNGYVFYQIGWFDFVFDFVMGISHLVISIGQYLGRNQRSVVSALIGGGFWVASISGRVFGKKSLLITDEEHGRFFILIRMIAFICIFFPIWYFVPFLIMIPVIIGFWMMYSIHMTFSLISEIIKKGEGDTSVLACVLYSFFLLFICGFMLLYEVEIHYKEKAKRKRGGE